MRVHRIAALTGCIAVAGAGIGAAEEAPSMSRLLGLLRERNPEILAARREWEAARERIAAERSWPPPQIGIEYWGVSGSGLDLGSAEEKWYDLSQTIPFPGKLSLRGEAARHEADRMQQISREVELEVGVRLKEAYYGLMFADRSESIVGEMADLMRRFARVVENKYSVAQSQAGDALKAHVELSRILGRRIDVQEERQAALARINALADRPSGAAVATSEEPILLDLDDDPARLESLALSDRPGIRAAGSRLESAAADLAVARIGYLPDLTLQYTWRTLDGRGDDAVAMARMDLPFVWFWRQRSLVRSAAARREEAEARLRAVRAEVRAEVQTFLARARAAREQVDLYRSAVLPQAEQSLRLAEAAYESGRTGFLELLDAARTLLELRLEYWRNMADYGAGLARLELALGPGAFEQLNKEEPSHE